MLSVSLTPLVPTWALAVLAALALAVAALAVVARGPVAILRAVAHNHPPQNAFSFAGEPWKIPS